MTWPNKKTATKTKTKTMTMTNTFREQPQWQWVIFWDIQRTPPNGNPREGLSLTNCYEFSQTLPEQKFHNFGQISQFQPNFTILEYLELGQFRNFCDVCYSWLIVETSQSWAPRSVQWAAVITNLFLEKKNVIIISFLTIVDLWL